MPLLDRIKKNLKYVKLRDVVSVFLFIAVYPLALIFRLVLKIQGKKVWLICESPDTARDNGYHFYKYLRNNHREISTYYAIDKNSADSAKISDLGNIIDYGSVSHWLYYLAADENISTQKSGNPAPALFYILHIYGLIKNNRIFLQHGITYNNLKWLYYNETRFKLFICGAKSEYNYVKSVFGYPPRSVTYTGFARFDNLSDFSKNNKQILVMPTWRNWLARETNALDSSKQEFIETAYYNHWSSLLNNSQLMEYLEENDIFLYFYPHFNMQKYVDLFKSYSKNVKTVNKEAVDIQDLLKESSLLITDYSSVFFDFAYMQKPIIHYQFDEKEFRAKQYEEGYFSYHRDGFGAVVTKEAKLVNKIIKYCEDDFTVEKKYRDNSKVFFPLQDQNNCQRIYNAILANERNDHS